MLKALGLTYVKRWVIAPMFRDQSVAEHSYRVAVIAHHLTNQVVMHPREREMVLSMALYHDVLEVDTGDIPGTYKDQSQKWPDPCTLSQSEIIVKVADTIEAYTWYMTWGLRVWGRFDPTVDGRDRQKLLHYTQDWLELRRAVYETLKSHVFNITLEELNDDGSI